MNEKKKMNPDDLYLIEQAVKAPSGHNTQPWLFRVSEEAIELLPDRSKVLPVVDPDRRELFISLGCAAENLCLAAAAKGYRPETVVTEGGLVRIRLARAAAASGLAPASDASSSLAPLIGKRQTNRSVYTGRLIDEEVIKRLLAVDGNTGIRIAAWPRGSAPFGQLARYVAEGNELQLGDAAFRAELKTWMRFNSKHVRQTRDGLTYAVFGAPDLPRWISEPVIGAMLNGRSQNKADRKKIASSSHLVLFASEADTPAGWVALGRALEGFLLRLTEAGVAAAFLNQPCELPRLVEKVSREFLPSGGYPQLLLRIGYACRPLAFSPRRRVEEFLVQE